MGKDRNSVLDIRNLSIEFATTRGRLKALRDVTLSVPPEKIVGLVGESGCGKSTVIFSIIHLLAENAVVTGGEIEFEGRDILKMSPNELRAIRGDRISMVFQDPMTSLNPVLSIDTQMTDIQYRANIDMEEKRNRAVEMLARVGIPDPQTAAFQLSPSLFRRHAAAYFHCHGPFGQSRPAAGRRADHRPGCHLGSPDHPSIASIARHGSLFHIVRFPSPGADCRTL